MHCHGEISTAAWSTTFRHLVRLVAPNISVAAADVQRRAARDRAAQRREARRQQRAVHAFGDVPASERPGSRAAHRLTCAPCLATSRGRTGEDEVRLIGRALSPRATIRPAALTIESLPPAASTYDANDPVSHGRYLTMSFCSECHGQNLEGLRPSTHRALRSRKVTRSSNSPRSCSDGVGMPATAVQAHGPDRQGALLAASRPTKSRRSTRSCSRATPAESQRAGVSAPARRRR